MSIVLTPTSPGELIDKITILQIKSERFNDMAKLAHVHHELKLLTEIRDVSLPASAVLSQLATDLKRTNEVLWDVEDNIRLCETAADFGPRFIALARSVYSHNDVRCKLKRQINELLGSSLIEEKSYRGAPSTDRA